MPRIQTQKLYRVNFGLTSVFHVRWISKLRTSGWTTPTNCCFHESAMKRLKRFPHDLSKHSFIHLCIHPSIHVSINSSFCPKSPKQTESNQQMRKTKNCEGPKNGNVFHQNYKSLWRNLTTFPDNFFSDEKCS